MYYALTIKDGIITGVHESEKPIDQGHFKRSPKYADDTVVPFDVGEYAQGHDVREYTDGILRPIVDRITDGLAQIPDGFELIDGELVKRDVPVEDAPPKLIDMLTAATNKIKALETELSALKPTVTALSRDVADIKLRVPIAPIKGATI